MIYGELGIKPLDCEIKVRAFGFWTKLVCGKADKISSILYRISRQKEWLKWNKYIESILAESGFYYLWLSETPDNYLPLK